MTGIIKRSLSLVTMVIGLLSIFFALIDFSSLQKDTAIYQQRINIQTEINRIDRLTYQLLAIKNEPEMIAAYVKAFGMYKTDGDIIPSTSQVNSLALAIKNSVYPRGVSLGIFHRPHRSYEEVREMIESSSEFPYGYRVKNEAIEYIKRIYRYHKTIMKYEEKYTWLDTFKGLQLKYFLWMFSFVLGIQVALEVSVIISMVSSNSMTSKKPRN